MSQTAPASKSFFFDRQMIGKIDFSLWGLLPLILIICLLPMLRLAWEGLQSQDGVTLRHAIDVLSHPRSWVALWHSIYVSVCATFLSMILGGLFAFLVALTNIRGKALLVFCFMIPMMIPPQITALSWLQLTGPNSPLLKMIGMAPEMGSDQPLYSASGIILLLAVQHAAIIFLILRANLRLIPREQIEAARLSGARVIRLWWDIILPITSPGLIAGAAMTFVTALGNFGIPAMLGIPANYEVLPTLIYARLTGFGPSVLSEVAILAILIAAIALIGVFLHHRMIRHRQYHLHGIIGRPMMIELGRYRLWIEMLMWGILIAILIIPLLALISASLVPAFGVTLTFDTLSFEAYREVLFVQAATIRSFFNSFILAGGAALTLFLLSLILAYGMNRHQGWISHFLNMMIEIPYALPGVVLAIACILSFQRVPVIDISLYGTLAIIFIAYLARFLVIALRPVLSSFAQMDASLEQAAQACGAGKFYRLRTILVPMVAPAAAAGALLVFLTAFNELTVSALLWSSGNETVGVMIFNLDDSGDSVLASAVAVLVVFLVFLLMLVLEMSAKFLPKGVVPWRN